MCPRRLITSSLRTADRQGSAWQRRQSGWIGHHPATTGISINILQWCHYQPAGRWTVETCWPLFGPFSSVFQGFQCTSCTWRQDMNLIDMVLAQVKLSTVICCVLYLGYTVNVLKSPNQIDLNQTWPREKISWWGLRAFGWTYATTLWRKRPWPMTRPLLRDPTNGGSHLWYVYIINAIFVVSLLY